MSEQRIYPTLRFTDATGGAEFLERAFGFERAEFHTDDDGDVTHAELSLMGNRVMVGTVRSDPDNPYSEAAPGPGSSAMYIALDQDIDAHAERAAGAGAKIVRGPEDMDYGSREYSALDPEGNIFSFGTYVPGEA